MTPEQLEMVASTSAVIDACSERFAETFYDVLFSAAPEVRPMFPDDMAAQRAKLVDEVVLLGEVASDLDGFLVRARALGARHRHYGVRAHDYNLVLTAIMSALQEILGEGYTAEVAEAWRLLYWLTAETMLEGATDEFFVET